MADKELALMAHLLRRAGFGATRDELEAYTAKGYEATVEELPNPGDSPMADEYILTRYDPQSGVAPGMNYPGGTVGYMYNLVNTKRPLEEKMTLLWHMFFATSMSKVGNYSSGPHHQDSGEAKIRESTAGVSRKPSSDGKACGCSSKHLCGLTAWNT